LLVEDNKRALEDFEQHPVHTQMTADEACGFHHCPHGSPIRVMIAQDLGFTANCASAGHTDRISELARFAVDSRDKRGRVKSVSHVG